MSLQAAMDLVDSVGWFKNTHLNTTFAPGSESILKSIGVPLENQVAEQLKVRKTVAIHLMDSDFRGVLEYLRSNGLPWYRRADVDFGQMLGILLRVIHIDIHHQMLTQVFRITVAGTAARYVFSS